MLWGQIKDAAIRLGFEPWLRPIVERIRGHEPEQDEVEAKRLMAALPKNAVCIDIGCNKGKFLDPMRSAATTGRFLAFEPVPYLYDLLKSKYRSDRRVEVFNLALSSAPGEASFFVNETDFGLSGLSDRPGRMDQDSVRKVTVRVDTLDRVVGEGRVDFIKIDVEGAEYDVLKGARNTIMRCKPVMLFEFGLGGADYFGVDARQMFEFFDGLGYALYTVAGYNATRGALDLAEFKQHFDRNSTYNFVAAPRA